MELLKQMEQIMIDNERLTKANTRWEKGAYQTAMETESMEAQIAVLKAENKHYEDSAYSSTIFIAEMEALKAENASLKEWKAGVPWSESGQEMKAELDGTKAQLEDALRELASMKEHISAVEAENEHLKSLLSGDIPILAEPEDLEALLERIKQLEAGMEGQPPPDSQWVELEKYRKIGSDLKMYTPAKLDAKIKRLQTDKKKGVSHYKYEKVKTLNGQLQDQVDSLTSQLLGFQHAYQVAFQGE